MRAAFLNTSLLVLVGSASISWGADSAPQSKLMTRPAPGQILAAGDKRLAILSPEGQVQWEYAAQLVHDVWMLENGHILFADGATVTEVTREKQVVFQYRAVEQKGGATYACQRLANGKTVIGENSTGRVLEVDAQTNITFALQTQPSKVGEHHNLRMVRKLENGHYLVCHSGAGTVKEYTPQGNVTWEAKPAGKLAFAAFRTPQGTTYVSSLDQIEEFDSKGRKTWSCSIDEIDGAKPRNLTGMQLLADGSLVTGCYAAYKNGQGCGLLQFSRDKKLTWAYTNPAGDQSQMAVQLLTLEGTPLPGPCLR